MPVVNLPRPNINPTTPELAQLRSYLYQLVEQIEWAINSMDTENSNERDDV